ncbi:MAG: ATP synthase F1 subunit epsilon [Vicingaceae bacterium]|nr:MAG: ATP synthase F1 subunit epsilon [Vicingaceae bacterium]
MFLEIISPDTKIYSGEINSAVFPGVNGSFGILNNHAPIISTLKNGKIKVVESANNKELLFDVNGGVVEIMNNKIIVLAE